MMSSSLFRFLLLFFTLSSSLHVLAQSTVAMHLLNISSDEKLLQLQQDLPRFRNAGVNTLFIEIDFHYAFKSHPELRQGAELISYEVAQGFASKAQALGIDIIPQFQCIGHQSWAGNTWALLTTYPELDLTPGAFPGNENIYCREWDITNPRVNEIVFPMIEEILTAFNAKGLHMGMDEIFLIGSKESPATFGKDPGQLFAQTINQFHDHFTKKKGVTLYMWGDRLIDGKVFNYGEWESSLNGTHTAIDLIPKDIVICDWHYEPLPSYPSVKMFIDKGFNVLPCSYVKPASAKALIKASFALESSKMLGHCFTNWSSVPYDSLLVYPAFVEGMKVIQQGLYWEVHFTEGFPKSDGSIPVALTCTKAGAEIRYQLGAQGTWMRYSDSLKLSTSASLNAQAYFQDKPIGEVVAKSYALHKAIGKSVQVSRAYSEKYKPLMGTQELVNATAATESFADGHWMGFDGVDATLILDLGNLEKTQSVQANFFNQPASWIVAPETVLIEYSSDGKTYLPLKYKWSKSEALIVPITVQTKGLSMRYVRFTIKAATLPSGHAGAGQKAWYFIDEISVQ
jgi:hypothetical protein